MFRKSRWEAFQQIAKDGRKNLHLTGPSGVGKSAALVAAVQWASENNWITW